MYSEARVGEILRELPTRKARTGVGNRGGSERLLPENINKKQSHVAQTIANNPETVEEVIKEAEAEGDVPTKGAVLRKVKKARESPGPALRYL